MNEAIVGLGTPVASTPARGTTSGSTCVDLLAERHGLEWESGAGARRWWRGGEQTGALLAKPLTFMNLSGQAVGELLQFYKIELARPARRRRRSELELGRLRARARGSAGGHNGLKSMIGQLGTSSSRGCGSASGAAIPGAISRITCWRGSTRKNGQSIAEAIGRAADAVEAVRRRGHWPGDEQVQPEGRQGRREIRPPNLLLATQRTADG